MIVTLLGWAIVIGVFGVEAAIPVAIAYRLGQRAERNRIERLFSDQAQTLLVEGRGLPRTRR